MNKTREQINGELDLLDLRLRDLLKQQWYISQEIRECKNQISKLITNK